MLVLALDTASHLCSAALFDTDRDAIVGRHVEDIGRGHAERLMDVIAAALGDAGAAYGNVGRIGVTVGPGSFTGIRVGVAAARGLALSLSVPSVGVTTLEALAASVGDSGGRAVMAVLDAKRDELFCQVHANGAPLTEPLALGAGDAAALARTHDAILVGSGASVLAAVEGADFKIAGTEGAADIDAVARLAARQTPGRRPAPLYLRSPDAKPQEGFVLARREGAEGRP